MTSIALLTASSVYEEDIDRERIVNGNLVPDDFFCPICLYLLWKPRSCSSCQHLFCEKCLRTWINCPSSGGKCPFRCQSFEERSCPSDVQSFLFHLNIRCRNTSFGCTEILSYDQLEYHQTVQCEYLSQRCVECDKLVLVSELDKHRQIAGLCIPRSIKCTICQNFIEKCDFRVHFMVCLQRRLNNQPPVPNNEFVLFQTIQNNLQLIEQQRLMSQFPLTLKGVDAVQRARDENCSRLYHILIMLEFFLINWSEIPYFLLIVSFGGLMKILFIAIGIYRRFFNWTMEYFYRLLLVFILTSYLFTYISSIPVQSVSDRTIIFCFTTFMFLFGCAIRVPLEVYEMDTLFNRPIINIIICCFSLFIMKIILLLIRWYFWYIPTYLTMELFLALTFFDIQNSLGIPV